MWNRDPTPIYILFAVLAILFFVISKMSGDGYSALNNNYQGEQY